jgi:hypothetical protein
VVAGLTLGAAARASDRATLDGGDAAWGAGDRVVARAAWRAAADAPEPAVRAQAEARLLLVSGNLGLAVHGPRAERALAVCPESDAWCALAEADLVLFARALGVPLSLEDAIEAADRAAPALPGPAAARRVWAGAAPPAQLDELELDALGRVIAAGDGRLPGGPGTWVAGIGVLGGSGQGVGGGLRLVHPDLGLRAWRLDATAVVTSRLAGQAAIRVVSPGPWGVAIGASGARLVADVYGAGGERRAAVVQSASATVLPGHRSAGLAIGAGPVARWDAAGDTRLAGHGASARARWTRSPGGDGPQLDGGVAVALADYPHQEADLSLRTRSMEGRLAGWLHAAAAPWSEAPYWRLPAAGGGQVLRHGGLGRFRGRSLTAAVLEWRARPDAVLGGVAFAEVAHIDGWHGGLGGGLRLRLPPRPHNTVRLDAAWGDGGWGITAGWGEAF